ncbi:hypothetical protein HK104_008306 [Borealophlyctis nickersoniae]|nr:hypothetical protein HK104_008306 [Borealophlyctis nickersoniae]
MGVLPPSPATYDYDYPLAYRLVKWGAFGFAWRTFSLAIQRRPYLDRFHWHVAATAVFAGAGYFYHQWDLQYLAQLEHERDKITKRRMLRLKKEQEAAAAAEGALAH